MYYYGNTVNLQLLNYYYTRLILYAKAIILLH